MTPPIPNYRQRVCQAKLRYSDANVASKAARERTKKHGMRNVAYRCPVCHFWHLTVKRTGRSR